MTREELDLAEHRIGVGRALAALRAYELYESQRRNVVVTAQENPDDLLHAHHTLDGARTVLADAIAELLEHRPTPRPRDIEIPVYVFALIVGFTFALYAILKFVLPALGGAS